MLVAQDLAWYGRDIGEPGSLAPLLRRLDTLASDGLARVRLLYLYPSEVRDPLVSTMLELPTVVPYFDLSLQHADAALLRAHEAVGERRPLPHRHRRHPRRRSPTPRSARRSSSASPARREREHDELLEFLEAASLDWAGFFPFSPEDGTPAASLPDAVDADLMVEWLRECEAVQEPITHARATRSSAREIEVLVDVDAADDERRVLIGRTHREAPEIDGVVRLARRVRARPGALVRAHVTEAVGPDLRGQGAQAVSTPPADAARCVVTATTPSRRPRTSSRSPG